jgi:elongation factor P
MATTNDLKNGTVLNLDGQLWTVQWFQHHKPGKGGAVVRTKLKNVMSGKVVDKTFNADVKVETANVDKRAMQYLYNDGESYVFMDLQTYDQVHLSEAVIGEAANYLLDNQEAVVAMHEELPLYIELPASVELAVEYTEPGLQVGQVEDEPVRGLMRRLGSGTTGEQLLDRYTVEGGQVGQLVHRDGAVPALVGADHDRLPAAL